MERQEFEDIAHLIGSEDLNDRTLAIQKLAKILKEPSLKAQPTKYDPYQESQRFLRGLEEERKSSNAFHDRYGGSWRGHLGYCDSYQCGDNGPQLRYRKSKDEVYCPRCHWTRSAGSYLNPD